MKRKCGACTLCCRLLPVRELDKPANTRCQFQRNTGCRVYRKYDRGFPMSCGLWSCQWLTRPTTEALKRPDRSHYVIDAQPDMIRVNNKDTGESQELACLQVWVDPGFPEAWHDPALLAFIDASGQPALIRRNQVDGFAIFPPSVTGQEKFIISGPSESVPTITGSRILDQLVAETA